MLNDNLPLVFNGNNMGNSILWMNIWLVPECQTSCFILTKTFCLLFVLTSIWKTRRVQECVLISSLIVFTLSATLLISTAMSPPELPMPITTTLFPWNGCGSLYSQLWQHFPGNVSIPKAEKKEMDQNKTDFEVYVLYRYEEWENDYTRKRWEGCNRVCEASRTHKHPIKHLCFFVSISVLSYHLPLSCVREVMPLSHTEHCCLKHTHYILHMHSNIYVQKIKWNKEITNDNLEVNVLEQVKVLSIQP